MTPLALVIWVRRLVLTLGCIGRRSPLLWTVCSLSDLSGPTLANNIQNSCVQHVAVPCLRFSAKASNLHSAWLSSPLPPSPGFQVASAFSLHSPPHISQGENNKTRKGQSHGYNFEFCRALFLTAIFIMVIARTSAFVDTIGMEFEFEPVSSFHAFHYQKQRSA